MNRDMIITDTEFNNNPLLRKMRDRFTCSGNMTIGEIMLHRAERETMNASTPTAFATPVAKREAAPAPVAVIEEPVKTIESPMKSSRRSLILSCVAIALCTVVLLAFIIPVFSNFGADATTDIPAENGDFVHTSTGTTEPVPEDTDKPVSNFDNVMTSVSNSFKR